MDNIRLIMNMSCMGSILMMFYIVMKYFMKSTFLVKWKNKALMVAIVYFMIPLPLLKNYYVDFCRTANECYSKIILNNSMLQFEHDRVVFEVGATQMMDPFSYETLRIILIIWVIGVAINVVRLAATYLYLRKTIYNRSIVATDEWLLNILEQQKMDLQVSKNITIRFCDKFDSPLTLGLANPVILMPTTRDFTNESLAMIFRHELLHIKQHDFLKKVLCMAVKTIHWYNPLAYILTMEFSVLCEYMVDEKISSQLDQNARKIYGKTILQASCDVSNTIIAKTPISLFCYSNDRVLKERMNIVKNSKPATKLQVIASLVTLMIVTVLSSFTVFAYSEHPVIENDPYVTTTNMDDSDIIVIDREMTEATVTVEEETNFVMDIAGNVIDAQINSSERAFCNHTFVDAYYIKHYSNSNGSCRMEYYLCDNCDKCNYTIVGDYYKTVSYAKCEHK